MKNAKLRNLDGKLRCNLKNCKLQFAICNKLVNQSGFALLITLLLITILTGLVVKFAYGVYMGTSMLSNWSNAQKASLTAKSGQTLSSKYLEDVKTQAYTYERKIELPVERDFGTGVSLSIIIEDENSRFNINSIIYPNGSTNKEALSSLKKLLEYFNIDSSIVMRIADWIDPDSDPRQMTSEYNAKNSSLWSVEELKFIEGVDENIFNTLSPFLTVYGDPLNYKININTARLPVLVSLHNDMTETLAQKIIDYRESTPFENTNELQNVSGMKTIGVISKGKFDVKSSNFRVISKATVNEITRVVESVMDTSLKVHYWREG